METETKTEEAPQVDFSKYDPEAEYTIEQWGLMKDLSALGSRLKAVLPAAEELSPWNAVAYAQACYASGANPFRGELYAWEDDDGKLVLDEGYKILVRWSKRQCDYSEWFKPLASDELQDGDIGVTCYVLRKDARQFMQDLIAAGMDAATALEIVVTKAVGVVRKHEMFYRSGDRKAPPKGWTWQQRAETRALKNCLNRAYGMPSMAEIAGDSWKVNDVLTQPQDWAGTANMLPAEREATAAYQAKERERQEQPSDMTATEAVNELFDDSFVEGTYKQAEEPAPENGTQKTPEGKPGLYVLQYGTKHKGKTLTEIANEDPAYLTEIVGKSSVKDDVKAAVTAFLEAIEQAMPEQQPLPTEPKTPGDYILRWGKYAKDEKTMAQIWDEDWRYLKRIASRSNTPENVRTAVQEFFTLLEQGEVRQEPEPPTQEHWSDSSVNLRSFWPRVRKDYLLSQQEVYEALGVDSIKKAPALRDALLKCKAYAIEQGRIEE